MTRDDTPDQTTASEGVLSKANLYDSHPEDLGEDDRFAWCRDVEDMTRQDVLTPLEKAAQDFAADYRWWLQGYWEVLSHDDPNYRAYPMAQKWAERDAAAWPPRGRYYAQKMRRPTIDEGDQP